MTPDHLREPRGRANTERRETLQRVGLVERAWKHAKRAVQARPPCAKAHTTIPFHSANRAKRGRAFSPGCKDETGCRVLKVIGGLIHHSERVTEQGIEDVEYATPERMI